MIHGLALVASLAAVGMQTQQQFTPVDGIAAVVGANVIPMSRLTEEMNVAFQSMGGIPNDSSQIEAIRTELLDRLIDEELLVQAAIRDTSIHVDEQRLVEAVDETVRRVRESFATETEFFTELRNAGFITEQRYRQYTADRQRRDMLRQELLNKLRQSGEIRELSPTEAEMRAYYQDALGQLPPRPPSISFRQIVVRPQADSVAHETARQLALSIRQELLADGDFAALARQYSQDPTTKDDGGQLGWFRRGVMHRAFEAVAFRLRPGQISNLVETPFGIHIIEVTRVEPAEVQARHILIVPEVTEADRSRALALADTLVELIRGGAPLDSLTRLYHDESEQAIVEGASRAELPDAYSSALSLATAGDVIGPVLVEVAPGLVKYAVVRVNEVRSEGPPTFADVREQIRRALAQEDSVRRYVQRLRSVTYIDIRT